MEGLPSCPAAITTVASSAARPCAMRLIQDQEATLVAGALISHRNIKPGASGPASRCCPSELPPAGRGSSSRRCLCFSVGGAVESTSVRSRVRGIMLL